MANILRDGNFAAVLEEGPARFIAPFPNVSTRYVLEQDYTVDFDSFTPLALNTAHPTLPAYKLVDEGPLQDAGGGVCKFTRKYAQIPASWSDSSGSYTYNFIGFQGSFGLALVAAPTGRPRVSRTVPVRLFREYFLIGAGGSYSAFTDIPVSEEQKYYASGDSNLLMDYLTDSPPFSFASVPSRTTYEGWIASGTEILVETQTRVRWMGNIWCRESRYIAAL